MCVMIFLGNSGSVLRNFLGMIGRISYSIIGTNLCDNRMSEDIRCVLGKRLNEIFSLMCASGLLRHQYTI